MTDFNVEQLRGMAKSLRGAAMDADDPDVAATCALAVDWMRGAGNEIERLRVIAYQPTSRHEGNCLCAHCVPF